MLPFYDELCDNNEALAIQIQRIYHSKKIQILREIFLYLYLKVNTLIISLHEIHPLLFQMSLKKKCCQNLGSELSVYQY